MGTGPATSITGTPRCAQGADAAVADCAAGQGMIDPAHQVLAQDVMGGGGVAGHGGIQQKAVFIRGDIAAEG